jgi:hypothetical protein
MALDKNTTLTSKSSPATSSSSSNNKINTDLEVDSDGDDPWYLSMQQGEQNN